LGSYKTSKHGVYVYEWIYHSTKIGFHKLFNPQKKKRSQNYLGFMTVVLLGKKQHHAPFSGPHHIFEGTVREFPCPDRLGLEMLVPSPGS
jgi:hypothetical protein